jgi:glycosyltransferase involved in cell wall biosynthesis
MARRIKISFFVHDLAANPVGRVVPIASALERDFDVEVLGLLLSGPEVYAPYRSLFPYRTVPVSRDVRRVLGAIPALARQATGDVIYGCKPLVTSFGPALVASGFGRRKPLLLDVEDDEWIPFGTTAKEFVYRDVIRGWRHATAWKYTRLLHPLIRCASGVTVVSSRLERRYGGRRLLHGPDEHQFDPDRADLAPGDCRRHFHLPPDRPIALFSGLPQPHKGWDVLLDALQAAPAADWLLVLVGDPAHPEFVRAQERLGERCRRLGFVPYAEQPRLLAAASAVPVPQLDVPFAHSQVSAKALDALAMRCPVIASRIGDFVDVLGGDGEPRGWLVNPGDSADLAAAFHAVVADPAEAFRRTSRGRAWFLREASASAIRARVTALLADIGVVGPDTLSGEALRA